MAKDQTQQPDEDGPVLPYQVTFQSGKKRVKTEGMLHDRRAAVQQSTEHRSLQELLNTSRALPALRPRRWGSTGTQHTSRVHRWCTQKRLLKGLQMYRQMSMKAPFAFIYKPGSWAGRCCVVPCHIEPLFVELHLSPRQDGAGNLLLFQRSRRRDSSGFHPFHPGPAHCLTLTGSWRQTNFQRKA